MRAETAFLMQVQLANPLSLRRHVVGQAARTAHQEDGADLAAGQVGGPTLLGIPAAGERYSGAWLEPASTAPTSASGSPRLSATYSP